MKRILFVCLGNICRSSSAEGVMKHLVEEAGRADEFLIDSAGILSYHQGELPDSRMRAHAARRGYQLVRPPWIQSDASFATRTYRGFLQLRPDYRYGRPQHRRPERSCPFNRRMEQDTPHDGILYKVYPCRPCTGPLLRRFRRV